MVLAKRLMWQLWRILKISCRKRFVNQRSWTMTTDESLVDVMRGRKEREVE